MKHLRILIICLLICFLAGCTAKPAPVYEMDYYGTLFTVDSEEKTISDGTHLYTYQIDSSGDRQETVITYPNGSTYYRSRSGNTGHGGWSEDYNENLYVSGDILLHILDSVLPAKSQQGHPLLGILFMAFGIWYAASPYSVWFFNHGWQYKNAEPSENALVWIRVCGFIIIVVGFILIFA